MICLNFHDLQGHVLTHLALGSLGLAGPGAGAPPERAHSHATRDGILLVYRMSLRQLEALQEQH